MCLDVITQNFHNNQVINKVKIGYKVFLVKNGSLYFPFYSTNPLNFDTWYKDNPTGTFRAFEKGLYKKGFHLFKTKKDAKIFLNYHFPAKYAHSNKEGTYIILKIKYNKVVAIGNQTRLKVVVAKEFYIPKSEFQKLIKT